jgi:hypothetical protein
MEALFLVAEDFAFHAGADAGLEEGGVEGFGEVVLGAGLDAADDGVGVVLLGKEDDGEVLKPGVVLDLREQIESLQGRQADLPENHVEASRAKPVKRPGTRFLRFDGMAIALEIAGEDFAAEAVVVDDQDASGNGFGPGGRLLENVLEKLTAKGGANPLAGRGGLVGTKELT